MLLVMIFLGVYIVYRLIETVLEEIEEDKKTGRKRKFWEY